MPIAVTTGCRARCIDRVKETKALAHSHEHEIQVWTSATVVCRRTQREVDDFLHRVVKAADWGGLDHLLKLYVINLNNQSISPEQSANSDNTKGSVPYWDMARAILCSARLTRLCENSIGFGWRASMVWRSAFIALWTSCHISRRRFFPGWNASVCANQLKGNVASTAIINSAREPYAHILNFLWSASAVGRLLRMSN